MIKAIDDSLQVGVEEFEGYNRLVTILYRCLHTNQGFQPFFDEFRQRFRCLQGGILGLTHNPVRMMFAWTFGYPEGFEQWFLNSDLARKDEALLHFSALPPRQFDSLTGCDPDIDILEVVNEDTREWVEAAGLGDSAGMLVSQGPTSKVVFLANRHRDEGQYTPTELMQMNMLAPHIENAVGLFNKIYQSRTQHETLSMALDHIRKPMIVIDEMARVVRCNASAEKILASHPRLFVTEQSDSRLQSLNSGFNRQLNDAILTSIFNARDGVQDMIALFEQMDDERLAICITPLSMGCDDEPVEAHGQYGALVELVSFSAKRPPNLGKLARLFNCTRAEAVTAGHLMHGLSISEAAEAEGLSVHTVRGYVKNLLSKNGYRRQAELVGALVRALD
ncbi:helix-turn-helix transcriptional regulator [Marinobacter daepoensis]|uniref:Helix-turn-helix transcriptional regulator n=1 Tax=Marinobacter daepoensis TaxID=262077 RepID=A0ABS3BGN4_9GAMM|nr:helix-turn-helix transcriptional regulator [Marinobacter daepoensis]MBN7770994.1 helix-turn-helix transcriptional regulator [Marinobacter daepoensis]MBY6078856.1 helix-turn-helix transcriptional regulator [Marinobacter daepoensis]